MLMPSANPPERSSACLSSMLVDNPLNPALITTNNTAVHLVVCGKHSSRQLCNKLFFGRLEVGRGPGGNCTAGCGVDTIISDLLKSATTSRVATLVRIEHPRFRLRDVGQ